MKFSRDFWLALLAVVCGGLAGAAVSFALYPVFEERVGEVERIATSTLPTVSPTSTAPIISLIPVERRSALPLLPPSFLKRRSSAIATLYRKSRGTSFDERLLGKDHVLGHAVALTSDGWFVTSATLFEGVRLADVTLWHNGSTYNVERGVVDRLNNTAFFKTAATGLAAPAFVQSNEVTQGSQVWVEARPDGFIPDIIVDHRARLLPNDYASSETAVRRYLLNSRGTASGRGGAVWDPNGSLLGVLESGEGEDARVIPASTIAGSFASLLERNEIRHAQLGVRAIDLGIARLDGSRGTLPPAGALVRVRADSPAAKAKLKNGDVILRVERDILDGTADLGEILADYRQGSIVTLRVLRGASAEASSGGTTDTDIQVALGSIVTSEPLK